MSRLYIFKILRINENKNYSLEKNSQKSRTAIDRNILFIYEGILNFMNNKDIKIKALILDYFRFIKYSKLEKYDKC